MATAQEIFSETLPNKLEGNEKIQSINSVYQFNITGDDGGSWTVDFTKDGDYVSEGESDDADVTIEMKDSDFVDMWEGKLPGPQAFMMGKIKIQGDMGLAMKLQTFMG
ncbi:SCP2 sterol-binding domain-containing protein [Persicimonas caeni]|uniref:SCP2 sterol-binding domain-containing protein n=1 Tax=Persicimonas caeni TaxID=2292766 RepID=A0A4Y6Q1G3_PERCE|nr:SCP2 sterol-binding domain-containing protein [Persicimonas caeni]QDG54416.1 SCP2 sterol-binding domain-containing protein [Persicimonas caeni]QED35637.1 SCP2 sterol-binding domain-containing protein [Persicimonas caeni]